MSKMNKSSMTLLSDKSKAVAQAFVDAQVDPNEVSQVVAALNSWLKGKDLLHFLDTVIRNGNTVVRSNRTLQYYKDIRNVCRQHLTDYLEHQSNLIYILGWAIRLMRYYRIENRLEQPPVREVQIQQTVQQTVDTGRSTGRIESFSSDRGFGFIWPDNGNQKQFFHKSQLPKDWQTPQEGQRVSFMIGQGPNGRLQAQQLKRE